MGLNVLRERARSQLDHRAIGVVDCGLDGGLILRNPARERACATYRDQDERHSQQNETDTCRDKTSLLNAILLLTGRGLVGRLRGREKER